jgi:hypothetical protein
VALNTISLNLTFYISSIFALISLFIDLFTDVFYSIITQIIFVILSRAMVTARVYQQVNVVVTYLTLELSVKVRLCEETYFYATKSPVLGFSYV